MQARTHDPACLSTRMSCHFSRPDPSFIFPHTKSDLSLIEERLREGDYYRSREMLLADLLRMCRNCKVYNDSKTEYHMCVFRSFWLLFRECLWSDWLGASFSRQQALHTNHSLLPTRTSAGQELETYIRGLFKKSSEAGGATSSSAAAGGGVKKAE